MWRHHGKLRGVVALPRVTQGTSKQGPLGFRGPTPVGGLCKIRGPSLGSSHLLQKEGMTSHLL